MIVPVSDGKPKILSGYGTSWIARFFHDGLDVDTHRNKNKGILPIYSMIGPVQNKPRVYWVVMAQIELPDFSMIAQRRSFLWPRPWMPFWRPLRNKQRKYCPFIP